MIRRERARDLLNGGLGNAKFGVSQAVLFLVYGSVKKLPSKIGISGAFRALLQITILKKRPKQRLEAL